MDPGPLFLALDQGGSASRALVFDNAGRERASARIEVGDRRPRPGWVDQDPEAVVDSLREAAQAAVVQLDAAQRARLQSCGLGCQRSSLVCWDRFDGTALSPVISWQDTRAADWLAAQDLDAESIRASTGLYPNANSGASKIRWCLDHLAAVREAAADGRLLVGPLGAFLAFRLVVQRPCVVDPANASRTLLFDLGRHDWNPGLLDRFGIDRTWLPRIAHSDAEFGDVVMPSRSSLPLRLPLRLLSGDQSTAAFAHGNPRREAAYVNVGTGAFIHRLGEPPAESRLLRSVIHWSQAPEYVVEGTVNGAGSALAWFASLHGIADVVALLEESWREEGPGDTLFLNGIGGLGSPDWRAGFASRFIGKGTMERQLIAVAESIAFLIQRNLGLVAGIGEPCAYVMISGGLSRSDRFCQTLSNLSRLPLRRPGQCEASARGTAFLLAGRPVQWARLPERRFEPRHDPSLQRRYMRWSDCMALALAAR